jgi:hypothetical protein
MRDTECRGLPNICVPTCGAETSAGATSRNSKCRKTRRGSQCRRVYKEEHWAGPKSNAGAMAQNESQEHAGRRAGISPQLSSSIVEFSWGILGYNMPLDGTWPNALNPGA